MNAILLLLLIGAEPTCDETYVEAQRFQRDGRLLAARTALVRCAQRDCPKLAQSDCAEWMEQVEARLPTIVLRVRDSEGRDLIGVRFFVDGESISQSDGRAIEVDPGAHQVRAEAAGFLPREETITTLEGEKSRRIDLILAPVAPPPPPAPSASLPVWIYVAGSSGLLGMGSFAYFAITSTHDYEELRARCAPGCSESEADPIARKQLAADLSLGAGIAGLSSALIGLLIYVFTDHESAPVVTGEVTNASSALWN